LQPEFLLKRYQMEMSNYPQIGFVKGQNILCFIPTGLSFLFIAGGNHLEERLRLSRLFFSDSKLIQEQVFYLERPISGDPMYSGRLILSQVYYELFTSTTIINTETHAN
jgi:hypothetical protein